MAEHFSLRWNNFHRNMSSGFRTLLMEDSLVDVTLAAEGRFVQAHRLVLSVCSPYFKDLFSINPCNHPIVILKDVHFKQLTDILSFMYQGEVNVRQEDLADFLKTAELLQIRGLAEQNADKELNSLMSCQDATAKHSTFSPPDVLSSAKKVSQTSIQVSRQLQSTSDNTCTESKANSNETPSVVAGVDTFPQPLSATSAQTCQSSSGDGSSTSVLLGVPIKQELPDVPSVPEQDSYEYLPGAIQEEETEFSNIPIMLHDEDSEQPQIIEKSLWTAPPVQSDASIPPARNTGIDSTRQEGRSNSNRRNSSSNNNSSSSNNNNNSSSSNNISNTEPPKVSKKTRKQRTIALSKIRRFLVTPKRSRRIAFARKMKKKKKVILKSGLSVDSVTDMSKALSAMSRNSINVKNEPEIKLQEYNKDLDVLNIKEVRVKGDTKAEGESTSVIKKKNTKVQETKKIIVSVANTDGIHADKRRIAAEQSKKHMNKSKYPRKKVTLNEPNSKDIPNSVKNSKNENNMKRNIKGKNNSAVNKKNIIVVIAAKKAKSAVALARKIQSPVRRRTNKTTKRSSVERVLTGATAHLRSSTPHSNFRDSFGTTNGQDCRHTGCLGCRGGN